MALCVGEDCVLKQFVQSTAMSHVLGDCGSLSSCLDDCFLFTKVGKKLNAELGELLFLVRCWRQRLVCVNWFGYGSEEGSLFFFLQLLL